MHDFHFLPGCMTRGWLGVGRTTAMIGISVIMSSVMPGCDATSAAIVGGVTGVAVVGGWSPAQEIEQVYYLGVYDPLEQVPPTMYRLTVRGQASALSQMKFGSGWVQANLIDSLNTHVGHDPESGQVSITGGSGPGERFAIPTGRKLMLYGPEGFRPAPKDHRLVIVMGTSPENFFNAVDQAVGQFATAKYEQLDSDASRLILSQMLALRDDQDKIDAVEAALKIESARTPEAK